MSDQSLPRRITIDVPLRGALIALAAVSIMALVVGSMWWLNSMAPLSPGDSGTASFGLGRGRPDVQSGTVFAWKRGGWYQVQLWFHNSSSLPLTITGADTTGAGWNGVFFGPTLNASSNGLDADLPFHPIRVAADGRALVAFTYHANPRVCTSGPTPGPSSTSSVESVVVHFEQVPGLPQTQTIPLGDSRFGMTYPSARDCAH